MSPINIGVEIDAIRAVFPQARIELVQEAVLSILVSVMSARGRGYFVKLPLGSRVGIRCAHSLTDMLSGDAYA